MANTKISELPVYTGDTTGVYLVMDTADLSSTYRVSKEKITNISGSNTLMAYFSGSNHISGANKIFIRDGGESLLIGDPFFNAAYPEKLVVTHEDFNIASFRSTLPDGYAEVNIVNTSTGPNSSTDLVLWNDLSTESSSYVDLGINSSNYSAGGVGFGGDGYLINAANDLYVGSMDTGDHGHTHIFAGNLWNSSSISIYNDGTVGFGTDVLNNTAYTIPSSIYGYTYEFSGSVKLDNNLLVVGEVSGSVVKGDRFQLMTTHPLPLGVLGSLAVSGSHLFFHNGSTWNQIG
jgi:hypothetical protein